MLAFCKFFISFKNSYLDNKKTKRIKATLFDGSYHDLNSSEMAYRLVASKALSKHKDKIKPILLEPIMDISVVVLEEYFGDIMGDLSKIRVKLKKIKSLLMEPKSLDLMSQFIRNVWLYYWSLLYDLWLQQLSECSLITIQKHLYTFKMKLSKKMVLFY